MTQVAGKVKAFPSHSQHGSIETPLLERGGRKRERRELVSISYPAVVHNFRLSSSLPVLSVEVGGGGSEAFLGEEKEIDPPIPHLRFRPFFPAGRLLLGWYADGGITLGRSRCWRKKTSSLFWLSHHAKSKDPSTPTNNIRKPTSFLSLGKKRTTSETHFLLFHSHNRLPPNKRTFYDGSKFPNSFHKFNTQTQTRQSGFCGGKGGSAFLVGELSRRIQAIQGGSNP